MHSRRCDFMPPGAVPQTCHSALPRTSNQSSTLHYEPLNRTRSEIRVLCPHTPTGSSIDKLEFTIRTVSLDDKPKYWALSYVWGAPKDTEPICIEGQTFMATRNLRDALKRVRNIMTTATIDLQLWIDAICINQADMTEKSWQVGIMARIYSEAHCVNIWLGLADHNAALAMEFVSKIGSPKFSKEYPLTDEKFTAICEESINCSLKEEGKENLELLWALEDIFHHRQYWKRAWTFQEFCLNSSIIWCGDSWFSLHSAINYVDRSRDVARRARISDPAFGNATPVVAKFIQCIDEIGLPLLDRLNAGGSSKNGQFGGYNEEEKLGILLCQTRNCQASEPKDKIYSLLGLCKVNINPDYSDSLSVGQLYQDTSALILKRVRSTEILTMLLSFAGLSYQGHLHCIPSWAVEWDMVAKVQVNFKALKMASNKNFIAEPPLHFSDREISFQAIIVDRVEEVYVPPFKNIGEPEGAELLKFFFNYPPMEILPFQLQFQPRYRTGVSLLTAVLSTLLLGRDVLSNNDYDRLFVNKFPCANFKKNARVFLRLLINRWKCTGTFTISLKSYLDLGLSEASPDKTQLGTREDIVDKTIDKIFGFEEGILSHEEVLEACSSTIPPANAINFHNKTPFGAHASQMAGLKSKEGYIGAGRAGVAPRDVICVLRDASIPFILRPVGDKFALVSPCYIEGLMDGEAWEMVQVGEKSMRRVLVI